MIKIAPDTNMQFCEDLRVVAHNRKFFGHHDGPGRGGTKRTMLLPSGIVLQYIEWGDEAAPPIVLLHDICQCAHEFDDIARPLADKYRVLAIDIRGHGDTSHSPKHQYGIEVLVEDLHELVVRLSLNGRDWGGAWTRPWVLVGRGMGAAIATAYATRHPGRCAGLVLWDYDPEWPKDRVNFYPYQAAHFANQLALASFFNDTLQLQEDGKYLSIVFVNRAYALDVYNDHMGCRFKMDPYFFVADFNPGIAWSMLREAATTCKVQFMWTQNSREWSYGRMNEISSSLRQGEHKSVETATVARGTTIDPESKHAVENFDKLYKSSSAHIMAFADAIDREARSALKAQGLARYEKISDEEIAAKKAEQMAARMAAREAAEAMSAEDKPIEIDDELLD
jgi:pimeloyl-ACP methyl ester carboxylesterase